MHRLIPDVFTVLLLCFISMRLSYGEQQNVGITEPIEIERFFESYLKTRMAKNHVAGAVVTVVKDTQILFSRGYGYADVDKKKVVDPEKCVFILGSLSKLFTWTAVMQLVEQGKIDLDVDINTYLDFKIPATFPQPITMKHLMSHCAGFEDNKFGQMVPSYKTLTPSGVWLRTHIPSRVRAPGQMIAYGNYGTALAGYIIERISGLSYDDYIEKNILTPLGMARTSSRQPMPELISTELSRCYLFENNSFKQQDLMAEVALNVAPAGAFKSTAGDIARFMIAHLNDGEYHNIKILQPSTVQQMHSRSFSFDARVNGMAHGFWEMDLDGQRIIGHAGSHFIFNNLFMLFPERKLGVFIATNSRGGSSFISDNYASFVQSFVKNFYPLHRNVTHSPSDFFQYSKRYTGDYHLTYNRSEKTPEKLISIVMSLRISADSQGLNVSLPFGNVHLLESEPGVFKQYGSDNCLVFHADSAGKIMYGSYDPFPLTTFVKSKWMETPGFNLLLLGSCLILFLSLPVITGTIYVKRMINGKKRSNDKKYSIEYLAWILASLFSICSLLFLTGVAITLFNFYKLYTGNLPLWPYLKIFSGILVVMVLLMVSITIKAWVSDFWTAIRRIYFTIITIGAAGFVWFLYFWNLLWKNF